MNQAPFQAMPGSTKQFAVEIILWQKEADAANMELVDYDSNDSINGSDLDDGGNDSSNGDDRDDYNRGNNGSFGSADSPCFQDLLVAMV